MELDEESVKWIKIKIILHKEVQKRLLEKRVK
jgi:hypothetical protein